MEWFSDLITNKALLSALLAWTVCQLYKGIYQGIKHHRWHIRLFLGSGGMPSSHAAAVTALTVSVGIQAGFGSLLFAVCLLFSIVVMYDAAGVRWETGKQSVIINEIMAQQAQDAEILRNAHKLKELVGHSPMEVMVGIVVGSLVGAIVT